MHAIQFEPELFRAAQSIDSDFGTSQACKVFVPASCMSDLRGTVSFTAAWSPPVPEKLETPEATYRLMYTSWPQQVGYNRAYEFGISRGAFKSLRGALLMVYEQSFIVRPHEASLSVARSALFGLMTPRGRMHKPLHSVDLTVPLDYDKMAQQCQPCVLRESEQDCQHETEPSFWQRQQTGWDASIIARLLHEIQLLEEGI